MISLRMDYDGPGSYDEILAYVTAVLEQNTYVVHDVYPETEARSRLARGMMYSILHRLGARGNECVGKSNDEMEMEGSWHTPNGSSVDR